MHPATRLKNLIEAPELLVVPGAYDALSARLIERAGFDAVQVSGFGISASMLGAIDASFTNLTDVSHATRNIVNAVDIPVMTDADTGFGNAVSVAWTINQLSQTGAAGANLEDQEFPKVCGRTGRQSLISTEEMVKKIEAAVDSRTHPDFVINARTDALILGDLDQAIERANAYAAAGATMIYVLMPTTNRETVKEVVDRVNAPISMSLPEQYGPDSLTIQDFQDLGVARLSVPLLPLQAVTTALERILESLRNPEGSRPEVASFSHINQVLGEEKTLQLEKKYALDN